MEFQEYFVILIVALVNMAVGALWYSTYLFGDVWMRLSGINAADVLQIKEIKKSAKISYLTSFVNAYAMGAVLLFLLTRMGVTTVVDAVSWTIVIWIGFVATTSLTNTMFTKRSKAVWLIDAGYHGVALLIMGVLLTLFL